MILGLGFGLLNFYIGRDQSGVSIRSDGSSFSRVRPNAIARPPTRNKFTLGRLSCSSPILFPGRLMDHMYAPYGTSSL